MMRSLMVTGGAGFVGSALVRQLIAETDYHVVNVDKLTYAGNLESLADAGRDPRHHFVHADICDGDVIRRVLNETEPIGIIHLAAESHVDRSIDDAGDFVRTNLLGTYTLLKEALSYSRARMAAGRPFRFLHVSTDEVFGSLGATGAFDEKTPYAPNSPYSASKAGSDHLARAWHRTHGLPVMVTNCSNNYGPYQFPEKLIPLVIQNGLAGAPMPVYGAGANVRDWLHVDDHARALRAVFERGTPGESYAIGGSSERTNLEVVHAICDLLDELAPDASIPSRRQLVTFVEDRPGHDLRYAIDASKIRRALGWRPIESFDSGLRTTVAWYLANQTWCERVQSGAYRGGRLAPSGAPA